MLQVVRGDESAIRWALQQLPWIGDFGKNITLAVVKDDSLAAVAIYNNFYNFDCQLTFVSAAPVWASRQVIRQILGFPFYETGRLRITTLTDENNHKAIRLNQKLGFVHEGTLRHGSPEGNGNAGMVYGLIKEDFERGKFNEHGR